MRKDREIPLREGEYALSDIMPNISLDEVLACIAQQIYWRTGGFDAPPWSDNIRKKCEDAARMAYQMAYHAQAPETPEYVAWKASQGEG